MIDRSFARQFDKQILLHTILRQCKDDEKMTPTAQTNILNGEPKRKNAACGTKENTVLGISMWHASRVSTTSGSRSFTVTLQRPEAQLARRIKRRCAVGNIMERKYRYPLTSILKRWVQLDFEIHQWSRDGDEIDG